MILPNVHDHLPTITGWATNYTFGHRLFNWSFGTPRVQEIWRAQGTIMVKRNFLAWRV